MVGVGKAQLLQLGHFGKDPIFDLPLELELRQGRTEDSGCQAWGAHRQHAAEPNGLGLAAAVSFEGSDRPVRPLSAPQRCATD